MAAGDWVGLYGADGYHLFASTGTDGQSNAADESSLTGISFAVIAGSPGRFTWDQSAADTRSLQRPTGLTRVASVIFKDGTFTIRYTFTGAFDGVMRIYAFDWDSTGRSETLAVTDSVGTVTKTMSLADYTAGTFKDFAISVTAGGTVTIVATKLTGENATISGVFFDAASDETVSPSAIASAEAFGTPTVTQPIQPTGIASAEAFGTPVIEIEQLVSPSGAVSAEAFGTPVVADGGPTTISPTGIASAEAFGTARVWRASDPEETTPRELLYDPGADIAYEWAINHSTEDVLRLGIAREPTSPSTTVGLVRQQTTEGRLKLHLEGFILAAAQLDTFNDFFDACDHNALVYRDAAGDQYEVVISRFDRPMQRSGADHYWRYVLEFEVLAVNSGPYVGAR